MKNSVSSDEGMLVGVSPSLHICTPLSVMGVSPGSMILPLPCAELLVMLLTVPESTKGLLEKVTNSIVSL